MTEAERLQKIVQAQEKELRRLRRLLETARVAAVDYEIVPGEIEGTQVLRIIGTCIGVDEYHFLEKMKPELVKIANALVGAANAVKIDTEKINDTVTGEPLSGGVSVP